MVGIYAVGETLVEPTGLVADYFDLPFPGLRASRVCRSKYLQRWYMPDLSPASVLIPPGTRESVDHGSVQFPAVVKPTARHSSQGVCTVNDRAELAAQLEDYPAQETILVEQKITGQEYSIESLTQDGKTLFASVTRKETTDVSSQYFVEMAHTVPAARDDAWDAVQRANTAMLDRLSVENGLTHAEFRIDERGEARLIEVAARTPGDGIMVLYQLATGRPMEPEILRIALGEPADYPRRGATHARCTSGTSPELSSTWRSTGAESRPNGSTTALRIPTSPPCPPTTRRHCAPSSSMRPAAPSWAPSAAPTTGPCPSSSTRPRSPSWTRSRSTSAGP